MPVLELYIAYTRHDRLIAPTLKRRCQCNDVLYTSSLRCTRKVIRTVLCSWVVTVIMSTCTFENMYSGVPGML